MANRDQLISKRTKELLAQGYPPGIVELSMGWAWGSASGMARYVAKLTGSDDNVETLSVQFLPQYLKDADKWIQSFGHKPKEDGAHPD